MRYVIVFFVIALLILDVVVNQSRVTGPIVREIVRTAHEISVKF